MNVIYKALVFMGFPFNGEDEAVSGCTVRLQIILIKNFVLMYFLICLE